jgi:hypothetical protein
LILLAETSTPQELKAQKQRKRAKEIKHRSEDFNK